MNNSQPTVQLQSWPEIIQQRVDRLKATYRHWDDRIWKASVENIVHRKTNNPEALAWAMVRYELIRQREADS